MDSASGKTIYAHWTVNTYSIVFDKNGGSGSMSNQSMTYDKASNLTTNTYTRQGYYFVGWSKTKLGVQSTIPTSNIYKDEESVKNLVASGSITLYAVWLDTWANHTTTPTWSGSSVSPYIIDSAEDLAWLIKNFNNGNKSNYFKQTTDINLSKYYWSPIGSSSSSAFMGVYDGQNNQITNLKIPNVKNTSGKYLYSYMGLFGYTKNATFKNLIIVSGEVYGNVGVGALVGQLTSGVVENAILQAGVKVEGYQNVGGIVGYSLGGTIKNCENYSSVNTTNWTCWGILGWAQSGNNTKIEDCMNFGKITSNGGNVGGITGGGGNFIVESCYNYGDLSAVGAHAGGIAGGVESCGVEIKNSYSKAIITGKNYAGGIIGLVNQGSITITGCGYEGTLTATSKGLIIGNVATNAKATVSDCFGNSSASANFYNGTATVSNSLYNVGGTKKYYDGNFANWVILNGQPLPSGLTWIGIGGDKVTNISQITACGYSKV